jgi:peroxiredoxin
MDFHKTMDDFRSKLTEADQLSKKMQPGSPEPDLRLSDATGNTIRLSSLSGKPHLIYFWGSWNAPSRKMNLELVPVYNEFREKGFEIYAIALDTQKETWINAYRLDKATWINVTDFKGLDSPAAKECGTGSIPTTILIGSDGKVVARNIQPAELKTWLMTHLNK